MLNQKLLILPLSFAGKYTGDDADMPATLSSQVLKTCNTLHEADEFVSSPANKGKALLIIPAFEMINSRYFYFLTQNNNTMHKSDIAEVAYGINRAYDHANGNTTVPAWADLPDSERQEKIALVQFYLDNPKATAADVHKQWLNKMAVDGWGHGNSLDTFHKQHPLFLDYINLPVSEKFKYHLFPQVVNILKKFMDVLPRFEAEPDVKTNVVISDGGNAAAAPNLLAMKDAASQPAPTSDTPTPPDKPSTETKPYGLFIDLSDGVSIQKAVQIKDEASFDELVKVIRSAMPAMGAEVGIKLKEGETITKTFAEFKLLYFNTAVNAAENKETLPPADKAYGAVQSEQPDISPVTKEAPPQEGPASGPVNKKGENSGEGKVI